MRVVVTDAVPDDAVYIVGPVGFDKRGRLRVSGRKIVLSSSKDEDA